MPAKENEDITVLLAAISQNLASAEKALARLASRHKALQQAAVEAVKALDFLIEAESEESKATDGKS